MEHSVGAAVRGAGALQGALKRSHRDGHAPLKKRVMLAQGNVPDLHPALKHTLAQFTLSSRSSLGGPAAFSARPPPDSGPLAPPPTPGAVPLLVPGDSSTELTYSVLEGEAISSFVVGGERRLCLPQVLNSALRDFSLQQINAVCDELHVYCARCDAQQLHVLKVSGVLPAGAPSCGLITQTDAQRVCNTLLRPGPGPGAPQPLLNSDREGIRVEHWCMGRCRGVLVPRLYVHPGAPCVQCETCGVLFTPQSFIMHSHLPPDRRTCHWGFDSAMWGRYLQLCASYQGTAEESALKIMLSHIKEKFSLPCQDPLVFSHLCSDIKQEVGSPAFIHPGFYLYDELMAPNVSLQKNPADQVDPPGTFLKHQYSSTTHDLSRTPSSTVKETKLYGVDGHCHPPTAGTEAQLQQDDKKHLLLEMVHMYNTQQQLETELLEVRDEDEEELRGLTSERGELQAELELMHTEHAQNLSTEEAYTRQLKELRERLDHAETERQELQEELKRERHARRELQLIISQLHQQINQSDLSNAPSNHNPPSISATAESADRQNTLAPPHTGTC